MVTAASVATGRATATALIDNHCLRTHISAADYRPDIDGLRAIAVLAVIGYHGFAALVPGGFVGVDVFFVISGYLISRHILAKLEAGSFSIRGFYARRIKRIFPALALVLAAATAVGWVLLTPGEYEALGRHIAGGAGFVANLVYWKEAGYFDTAADTKPLLHLWSLGVEEQFYIAWPLVLALLFRQPRHLGVAVAALLCASLAFSVWLVGHDVTADFYSPLSRFWELALGAAVAYLSLHRPNLLAGQRTLLSWFGLALIAVAIVALRAGDRFPGAWALLPTLGAAALIHAGMASPLNRRLLASGPLVWIGLSSYPLYLWHWPLLSFARIAQSQAPAAEVRALLLVISVALAWLTYRSLELPVRAMSGAAARKAVLLLSLAVALLFVAGVAVRKFDGFKSRHLDKLNADVATLTIGADKQRWPQSCGIPESQRHLFQFCRTDGREAPRFALLGDSKAEALYYGLARESHAGMRGMLIGSVVPPRPGLGDDDPQQLKNRLAMQAVLDDPAIAVVAFVVALRSTFPVDPDTGFVTDDHPASARILAAAYDQAIDRLEQAGKSVVFVIDNPTFPDPRSCIDGGMTSSPLLNTVLQRKANPRCAIRYDDHLAGTRAYRQFAADLAARHPRLVVYDPTALLCDTAGGRCTTIKDGKFLYSYSDHISDYANSLIATALLPLLEDMARPAVPATPPPAAGPKR